MSNAIEFKDFTFQYQTQKKPTLYNINLTIKPGEKVLIVGPSGCGKSTLAHCVNGLIPYSYKGTKQGKLLINGIDSEELDIFKCSKQIGTVLQDTDNQFVGLNVGEDIAFALENDCVPTDKMHEIVDKVSDVVGMKEFKGHSPLELSGGQKQNVCLAGVMVDDAPILLFDEPLANLDPATGKKTMELIDEISKDQGKTILIIEHRLEDVLHIKLDHIVLMDEGRIIADMTSDDLLKSNNLEEHSVRLPLYVQALKYAGVNLDKVNDLSSDDKYNLNGQEKLVHSWYKSNLIKREDSKKDVLLSLKNVTFSYDGIKNTIDDISVDIHKGEMISIVGKNGAGKSTLCKCICGFEKIDSGDIYFGNENINDWSVKERADKIGFVLQNPNHMICNTMIYDEVALGLVNRGKSEEEIKPIVEETLKICGLYPFRNWPISALSYGQKKRVTIASILALKPSIIILDEPTAGQDYKRYSEIMSFLSELNKMGITIIMITHDMHLMLEYTERTIVVTGGKIIADDIPSAILSNEELIDKACLKKTSLDLLAGKCDIDNHIDFIDSFIDYERKNVR